MKPHEPGLITDLAKRIAPWAARITMQSPLRKFLPLAEAYCAIIQGKGAGSGWDLRGEVDTAAACIQRTGAVIFDVGANRGEWSVRLAHRLGQLAPHLFLFEPNPDCVSILRTLPIPHLVFLPAAMGAASGIETLHVPEADMSQLSTLHPRRDSYHQKYAFQAISVPQLTIDEVMSAYGLGQVDFLKLDVEGHELAVLQGATKALQAGRIRHIAFEFGSANINARVFFHDLWDFLTPYGFSLARIAPGGILAPIDEYYEDLEYFRGATNFLAKLTKPISATAP